MGQWTPIYDMFWGFFGGHAEWLFVRPETRGSGLAAAIIAAICAEVSSWGGRFLRAGADEPDVVKLYERVDIGAPTDGFLLSAVAFKDIGALAGSEPRDIVRRLLHPSRNSED